MDKIDRQIVHCLQRAPRATFRRIGEVLGVSEQTVARRYRALHDAGAIRVHVTTDARAMGGQTWFARILCRPGSASAIADAVAARPDVSWVSVTSGGSEVACAIQRLAGAAETSDLLDRLPRVAQVVSFDASMVMHMRVGGEAEWLAFDDPLTPAQIDALLAASPTDEPEPRGPLTPLLAEDAPLLAGLASDGRATVTALAAATGWPRGRVASRLAELLASGSVRVDVDLAAEAFGFHAAAIIRLAVAPGRLDATVDALAVHPETGFVAAVTGASNVMVVVTCRDTEALYSFVTTKVGAVDAVQRAEVVPVLRRVKHGRTLLRDGRLDRSV